MAKWWLNILLAMLIAGGSLLTSPVALANESTTVSAATAGTREVGVPTNIWGTASGAPGRPVSVQVLVNGAWSTSQSGTTSGTGFYALPLTYGMNAPGTYSYRAVVRLSVGWAVSPTVTLTRTQRIVTVSAATAGSKDVGVATNIWGTASGAPYRPVSVQVLVNGAWSTSQSGTTSGTGFYALPLTYGINTPGTYSYRAVVRTSTGYAVSPTVTLTRTQRTVAQTQAIRSAEEYLEYMPFSRVGLIGQLEYEGFSTSDATYAVDHIRVDWKAQAVREAKGYLEYAAFSESGLVAQLRYEEYTEEQALYGVQASGADWMEQAHLMAVEYLDSSSFSRSELIDQLEFEGFTPTQAAYGASSVGL